MATLVALRSLLVVHSTELEKQSLDFPNLHRVVQSCCCHFPVVLMFGLHKFCPWCQDRFHTKFHIWLMTNWNSPKMLSSISISRVIYWISIQSLNAKWNTWKCIVRRTRKQPHRFNRVRIKIIICCGLSTLDLSIISHFGQMILTIVFWTELLSIDSFVSILP